MSFFVYFGNSLTGDSFGDIGLVFFFKCLEDLKDNLLGGFVIVALLLKIVVELVLAIQESWKTFSL